MGFSLQWLLLQSTGSRHMGFSSCGSWAPETCGILPDQGLNPCPLHRQAESQPLDHQEVPEAHFKERGLTSLVVQWLRLHAPNAGGPDSTRSQGTGFHTLNQEFPYYN